VVLQAVVLQAVVLQAVALLAQQDAEQKRAKRSIMLAHNELRQQMWK